jgi:putative PIN family toxin of toxin-antitoxin system
MIRAVIDLTELVRVAVQGPARSLLFQRWEAGAFVWVTSAEMIAQFEEVTTRPRLQRRIRAQVSNRIADVLSTRAVVVTPVLKFPHGRDVEDDVVIAAAVAARVDFIVTADRDWLDDLALVARLRDDWNIRVVRLSEFLSMIQ